MNIGRPFQPKSIEWIENERGCWICTSHKPNASGYPAKYTTSTMSRFLWAQCFGEIEKGLCVLHHCDNRACINPEHFFLGTNADNVRDKVSKGRCQRLTGENNGRQKLTWEQVRKIRADPRCLRTISIDYGVGKSTVHHIKKNNTWQECVQDQYPPSMMWRSSTATCTASPMASLLMMSPNVTGGAVRHPALPRHTSDSPEWKNTSDTTRRLS